MLIVHSYSCSTQLLLMVYLPPTVLVKEYTFDEILVAATAAPLASTIFGAAAPVHGDSKTTSSPTSDVREIGENVPSAATPAETTNAP
eukprot:m.257306 g.257306  ORF g.257306 m.257306 type:complete len:88 (-) comp35158_c0_seq1:2976-3239(-)